MSDSKKKYWFKRKRYGYGWIPVTWQGWLATLGPVAALGYASYLLFKDFEDDAPGSRVLIFLILVGVMTVFVVWIAGAKGPKPKWRAGKKPEDDPDEDW